MLHYVSKEAFWLRSYTANKTHRRERRDNVQFVVSVSSRMRVIESNVRSHVKTHVGGREIVVLLILGLNAESEELKPACHACSLARV